jgi:hypothetical protein
MDGPMQETPAPEGVYRYRDLGAISQRWPATAAVVLADDPDELLARLSEAYLAQAQLRMRQVLVAAEVPVRALGWGWVHAGHGGLWGGGDRAHLPFGSVGWLLRTGHEDWLERAAELLPAALAAFCASVLDDFDAFAADYWASLRILMRDAGARGELVKPEVLPPERLGAPALWGAPWRALDGDDRAGFEAALHALERACSSLTFDVVSIGYHRLALGRGLWPDRAARR